MVRPNNPKRCRQGSAERERIRRKSRRETELEHSVARAIFCGERVEPVAVDRNASLCLSVERHADRPVPCDDEMDVVRVKVETQPCSGAGNDAFALYASARVIDLSKFYAIPGLSRGSDCGKR